MPTRHRDRAPFLPRTHAIARLAQLHGKGRLKVGETFSRGERARRDIRSRLESETDLGALEHCARHRWVDTEHRHKMILIDDREPLAYGFRMK